LIKLTVRNAYTQVECNEHGHELISNALSYKDPNADAIRRRDKRLKNWNGYRSLYAKRTKAFPSGLLSMTMKHLQAVGYPVNLIDARIMPNAPIWPISLHGITLRDYQLKSVAKFMTAKRGILKLGTGAGKTETAIAIAKSCGVPMIFLTHRVNLMYQAAERFAQRWPEMKNQIGIVGDSQFDLNYLTFATVQTLHTAIKNHGPALKNDLKQFGLLVVDEAHRIGAKQFHETAGAFPNAYWRLGLTATPFMHEDPAANLQLLGSIGPIVHEVGPSELIAAGVLARPYFKFFDIDQPSGLNRLSDWRDIYEKGIIHNEFRNKIIASNVIKLVGMGHKTLIIVQEITHGKIIKQMLDSSGIKTVMVTGSNDAMNRMTSLKKLSSGRLEAIICTNIFDEGVDVKDISAIVLAAGTKAAPSFFQRAGRAIRKKDDGGNAIIIDFIDRQHRTLEAHSVKRMNFVKSEREFKII